MIKKELYIISPQARTIEYWKFKAVFPEDDGTQRIRSASRPAHTLGKCIVSVKLLAYLLDANYADALPLYQLDKIFIRYSATINRIMMTN
jgi:transposase